MRQHDRDPGRVAQAVEGALDELRRGRMVLVVDDEDRENEGDLIMAAQHATPETIAFIVRHTTGLVCTAMTDSRADDLGLPLMVARGDDPRGTAFTVSVDLKAGASTGVSAAERAATIRALADEHTRSTDLSRPGHVFPLRAREGGVLRRAGHTEATVDLCRLAGLAPVGVLAEVVNDDGTMARRPQLATFAQRHRLAVVTVADIVQYRLSTESTIRREAAGRVPTEYAEFTAVSYRSLIDDTEHVALVLGDVDQAGLQGQSAENDQVLVRVHSECLTGDVFGSRRCDCGEQLGIAMSKVADAGRGVIVYLRGHEGRGIGISHKLRAYNLQDAGMDTVQANLALGLPVDARDYGVGAQILRDLGVRRMRLMTNNPAKYQGLSGFGVRVSAREPLVVPPNPENSAYLAAKGARMGHSLDELGTR